MQLAHREIERANRVPGSDGLVNQSVRGALIELIQQRRAKRRGAVSHDSEQFGHRPVRIDEPQKVDCADGPFQAAEQIRVCLVQLTHREIERANRVPGSDGLVNQSVRGALVELIQQRRAKRRGCVFKDAE